jgi:hypothetical protein
MNIHQVNSKETMLSESDIVIVAAHMADPSEVKKEANKLGVSSERLLYTIYVQEMQNPALIRIRDGNTLFTIAALPERYGYVSMYNGDIDKNVATNFSQFLQAAYKMGFNVLFVKCGDDSLNKSAKEVLSIVKNAEFAFDDKKGLLIAKFNQPHGD